METLLTVINPWLLYWIPVLIAAGFFLKHKTTVPNDKIDIILYGFAFVIALTCGFLASPAHGWLKVLDALIRYGIGQGFIISALATHLYGVVHGIIHKSDL